MSHYTNSFSSNGYQKNDKIICKYTVGYYIIYTLKANIPKENASLEFRLKNRSNKKLSFRRSKT